MKIIGQYTNMKRVSVAVIGATPLMLGCLL